MTWLPGYKLDKGFHRQQHAVNCVLLCLIAKAETVLSLCIDEFLLLYQICYRVRVFIHQLGDSGSFCQCISLDGFFGVILKLD